MIRHRRIQLLMALALSSLGLAACSTASPKELVVVAKPHGDATSEATLVKTADLLRARLRARDQWAYRALVFVLFKETSTLSNTVLTERIRVLARDIEAKGADGVDVLLVHYVDAAATRKLDPASIASIATALGALRGKIRYADAHPANVKIPFGRSSTRLVLDVRAGAMSAFVEQTVGFLGPGIPSLDEILGDKSTTDALCALPPQKDQNGQVPAPDQDRQKNCASSGKPGGGNGASGALGNIADSGCINAHAQELQQMAQQLEDMEECMEGRDAFHRSKVPAFAWVPVGAAVIVGVGVIDFLAGRADSYVDGKRDENERYRNAVDSFAQAVDKAAGEAKEADEAERAAQEASDRERAAKSDARAASDAANNAPGDAGARQRALDAEKAAKEAEKTRKAAEEKAAKERKEADKAYDDAAEAGAKAEGARPEHTTPDESGMYNSAACKRAVSGGRDLSDPVTLKKLQDEWAELKDRRPTRSNWDRDDNPFTALEQPICGLDGATTQGAASGCKVPVMCGEGQQPNASCSCSKVASGGRVQALQQLQCVTLIRCTDGSTPTAVGPVCSCGPAGGDAPEGTTLPPRPTAVTINAFFATPKEISTDPARLMVDRIMRDVP